MGPLLLNIFINDSVGEIVMLSNFYGSTELCFIIKTQQHNIILCGNICGKTANNFNSKVMHFGNGNRIAAYTFKCKFKSSTRSKMAAAQHMTILECLKDRS